MAEIGGCRSALGHISPSSKEPTPPGYGVVVAAPPANVHGERAVASSGPLGRSSWPNLRTLVRLEADGAPLGARCRSAVMLRQVRLLLRGHPVAAGGLCDGVRHQEAPSGPESLARTRSEPPPVSAPHTRSCRPTTVVPVTGPQYDPAEMDNQIPNAGRTDLPTASFTRAETRAGCHHGSFDRGPTTQPHQEISVQ